MPINLKITSLSTKVHHPNNTIKHISMKLLPPRQPLLPPKATAAKVIILPSFIFFSMMMPLTLTLFASMQLFFVGSTVGPLVDSLHNQCLLAYDVAPITISNPAASWESALFCSSWAVPPLLGVAYIVLGFILPKLLANITGGNYNCQTTDEGELRNKAIWAVISTAFIIKLSEYLQTHDIIALGSPALMLDAQTNLGIMAAADAVQWLALDRTPVALLAATITAVGGPLSEMPFVAHGFWHYLPESADYLPLSGYVFQSGGIADELASMLLGEGYEDLSLSSITGPCYFAVTLDAIALGRYFYQSSESD